MAAQKNTDGEAPARTRAGAGETEPAKAKPKREHRPIAENPGASLNLLGRARKGR